MHCCEFCLSDYEVRPQVKNPRACLKPECQGKRQRANEREWRARHLGLYDFRYHAAKREQRTRWIQAIAKLFQKCIQMGANLTGMELRMAEFGNVFEKFLLGLGVRQINKFWKAENVQDFAILAIG